MRLRLKILYVVVAALLVAALPIYPGFAAPGGPNGTNGSYKVTCRGSYEGDGNVACGGNNVNINIDLTNPETGVSGKLKAHLDVDNGRFSGMGTFLGNDVVVNGRVEKPDGKIVTKARLMGHFTAADGLHGKFWGERKGP